MVNREINFNRKKIKKLKTIRDKKRFHAKRNKHVYNTDSNVIPVTKKEAKRQKNITRIYKELDEKEKTLLKDKHIKRRSKRGGKKHKNATKTTSTEMIVEN